MKKILLSILGLMFLINIGFAYDAWTSNVNYVVGDIITYNGQDYECLQSHTSQDGWTPVVVPALWTVYVNNDIPFENGVDWIAGTHYNIGNEIMYNNQLYVVRQEHTSQFNWKPDSVLALYKPIITSTSVVYLPQTTNYDSETYINMDRTELNDFMDFTFVESKINDDNIEYVWSYLHPQISDDEIEWVYKPISVKLYYSDIELCLSYYTLEQSKNLLLYSEEPFEIGTNESLDTFTSVKQKAQKQAVSALDDAIYLQNKLQSSEIGNDFSIVDFELFI